MRASIMTPLLLTTIIAVLTRITTEELISQLVYKEDIFQLQANHNKKFRPELKRFKGESIFFLTPWNKKGKDFV